MIMLITLIVIIVFIISIILPIRKENEIVYEHDWDDGGRSAVCYYNIYGVKIKTIVKQVKNMKDGLVSGVGISTINIFI